MKKILLSLLALAAFGSASAQGTLNVPTVTRAAGDVKEVSVVAGRQGNIKLELAGSENYRDMQFNLTLPEGITIDDDANVTIQDAAKTHIVVFNNLLGTYVFIIYNMYAETFTNGIVVNIPVTVADSYTGSQDATLSNVQYTLSYKVNETDEEPTVFQYNLADATFPIRAMLLGDVNDSGNVTAVDAVNILFDTFNNRPDLYVEEVADVNGDNKISAVDAVDALFISWGSDNSSSAKPFVVEDEEIESEIEPD